ncbi:MAG: DUF427 domain-containing protein [Candidatus Dormibacteraeota bacterium]|nr:DUF427 domain-containing protein [Candidatus Dormibacteraeota bacterium]
MATVVAGEAIRVETGQKRVRAYAGGHLVADTMRPLLVWEHRAYPLYYIPRIDVLATLRPTGEVRRSEKLGDGEVHDVEIGGQTIEGAALIRARSESAELRDAVRFEWKAMDEWLEEDEPVYTHPRNPYTRIDILASSRHVRIELDSISIAETRQPRILFETHLMPRYYMPLSDVRLDLLRPSERVTHCPYKGAATYWSVDTGTRLHPDIVWMYRSPLAESQKIAGLASFYDERCDLFFDGLKQERPRPPFR